MKDIKQKKLIFWAHVNFLGKPKYNSMLNDSYIILKVR